MRSPDLGVAGVQNPAADHVHAVSNRGIRPKRQTYSALAVSGGAAAILRFPFHFDGPAAGRVWVAVEVVSRPDEPPVIRVGRHEDGRVVGVMSRRVVGWADSRRLIGVGSLTGATTP